MLKIQVRVARRVMNIPLVSYVVVINSKNSILKGVGMDLSWRFEQFGHFVVAPVLYYSKGLP